MKLPALVAAAAAAACTTPSTLPMPTAPPPLIIAPTTASPVPPLDDAAVKERSHHYFEALDRADSQTFTALVGPSFVRFFAARFYNAKLIAGSLDARRARHEPVRSRTWSEEHVFIGPNEAVFIGESIEHTPATGDHPAGELDGWNTLVWVRAGQDWRVAHAQWQPGGADAEKSAWNLTYQSPTNFNQKPNQLLVDAIKGKKPGTALDVAMGQGRNAIYLASQGWKVTGVDFSEEGIKIAKAEAARQKLKLDTVQADLDKWDYGSERWDLVTLIYAGADKDELERTKKSVKRGGMVVLEYFAKESTEGTGIGGVAPGELAAAFAGWKIVKDEIADGVADWGLSNAKLARFVAEKP